MGCTVNGVRTTPEVVNNFCLNIVTVDYPPFEGEKYPKVANKLVSRLPFNPIDDDEPATKRVVVVYDTPIRRILGDKRYPVHLAPAWAVGQGHCDRSA